MPMVLLERLPLPSLRTYASISAVLLASAVYYASQMAYQISEAVPEQQLPLPQTDTLAGDNNVTRVLDDNGTSSPLDVLSLSSSLEDGTGVGGSDPPVTMIEPEDPPPYMTALLGVLLEEAWCVWVLINTAYCCLILLGKLIQRGVFGELRVSEQQHLKDKFWNFVFYNFIFIFGVMNVQTMEEVVTWCAWFSLLGFFHLLSMLCKDRFEYLSFSPTTPVWTHAKVLLLLAVIQTCCSLLLGVCFFVGMYAGIHPFTFMLAECVLLIIKTFHVIVRYAIHLWDLYHEGVWENRSMFVYYSELIFELTALSVDFAHHLHMLLYGNIFLSMASLVICMQLRYLFHEFQRRIRRHKNYLRVVNSMEARFPIATLEDLEANSDDCAICWDKMETARKLPCGHLFHNSCLRSWLEQDTSCPTCRSSLNDQAGPVPQPVPGQAGEANIPPPQPVNQTTNHFFHFDGSRYVSWLPSFSVEVTHTQILGNGMVRPPAPNSQFDNMARQVQGVFPGFPLPTIIEDLRATRSVEVTIENILEGRLVAPPNANQNARNTGDSTDSHSDNEQDSSSQSSDDNAASGLPVPGALTAPAATMNFDIDGHNDFSSEEESDTMNDVPVISGSRFSKSPSEREDMLCDRKEALLEHARRRYISKHMESQEALPGGFTTQPCTSKHDLDEDSAEQDISETDSRSDDSERRQRRELAYQAAQRRMNGQEM